MFCALRSSLILSLQVIINFVFIGFVFPLHVLTEPRLKAFCRPFLSHARTMCAFFSIVSFCPRSSRVTSFRILSLLLLPSILRSQLISATSNLLSSSLRMHQHSDPYSSAGITKAPYSFIFVLVDMLFAFHILSCSVCRTADISHAKPILRCLMSFVHRPSSVIRPPKFTNCHSFQGFILYSLTSRSACCSCQTARL